VDAWHAGRYTAAEAIAKSAHAAQRWEGDGTYKWMAYDRRGGALVGRDGVSLSHVDGADRYEVG
jgi:hypothetical protein